MKQKIAIQGELGSYSHLAANEIYDSAEVIPCKTLSIIHFNTSSMCKNNLIAITGTEI